MCNEKRQLSASNLSTFRFLNELSLQDGWTNLPSTGPVPSIIMSDSSSAKNFAKKNPFLPSRMFRIFGNNYKTIIVKHIAV